MKRELASATARTARLITAPLSRRTLLRGAGVTLGLPLLEAMSPSLLRPGAAPKTPARLVYVYVPNGVHLPSWTPEREGRGFQLSRTLEPLEKVASKVSVLSGLVHDKARANGDGPGDHARAASVFLTGVQPVKDGAKPQVGISADQVVAAAIGHETRFRSLELGCELGQDAGECDSGYACAYNFNLSWKSPTQPAPAEVDPRLLFERLFGDATDAASAARAEERRARGKSLLDFVGAEVKRLRKDLGEGDKKKLEQYLDAVRELERKLAFAAQDGVVLPTNFEKPTGIPREFSAHCRAMYDVLALALQSDLSRVATFMYLKEVSGRTYPEIGVKEGHHSASHHGNNADNHRVLEKINKLHVSLLAEFLEKLDAVEEDGETLLDHTMVCYGSGISDGDKHNHEDLPVLLAGGGGISRGKVRHARHEKYGNETPMNDLHVALMKRMGVDVKEFGDAEGELSI